MEDRGSRMENCAADAVDARHLHPRSSLDHMSTYLIVSAAFLTTGGQDRANHALASYLARRGHRVHLVAHEVDDALLRAGDVTWHRAPKPLNSTLLGEPLLQRIGTRIARELARD